MRLIQLHKFYQAYIDNYNVNNPELSNSSYNSALDRVLLDGFSGGHLYAAETSQRNNSLFIYNWRALQQKWFKESFDVEKFDYSDLMQMALEQIQLLKPDVLYLSHPVDFSHHVLSRLEYRPKLIVGWRAANIPASLDWQDYDVVLSHLHVCRQQALSVGAKDVAHFFPGFPLFIAERLRAEPKIYDVVFSGHWSEEHKRRNAYIQTLCEYKERHPDAYSLGLFIAYSDSERPPPEVLKYCQPAVWGIDMYRALKQARIVVNAEIDLANGEAGNMRLFESTGVGSFLLTEFHDNLKDYFKPGLEVESFHNSDELLEKVLHYLKSDTTREQIAEAGRIRCHTNYSLSRRCKAFLELISTRFGSTTGKTATFPASTASMSVDYESEISRVRQAEISLEPIMAFLKEGKVQEAMNYLLDLEIRYESLPYLHYTRARIYLLVGGHQEQAIQSLKQELATFPEHSVAQELLDTLIKTDS